MKNKKSALDSVQLCNYYDSITYEPIEYGYMIMPWDIAFKSKSDALAYMSEITQNNQHVHLLQFNDLLEGNAKYMTMGNYIVFRDNSMSIEKQISTMRNYLRDAIVLLSDMKNPRIDKNLVEQDIEDSHYFFSMLVVDENDYEICEHMNTFECFEYNVNKLDRILKSYNNSL